MHVLLLSPKTTAEPTSYIIHSATSVSKKRCRVRGKRRRMEEVDGNLDRSHTDPPTGVNGRGFGARLTCTETQAGFVEAVR